MHRTQAGLPSTLALWAARVICAAPLWAPALAQAATPVHRLYGADYQFSPQIYHVVQDADGLLWVAQDGNGVMSFDGFEVQPFTTRQELPSNGVNCVLSSRSGRLWIAFDDGPPMWLERHSKGGWRPTPPLPDSAISGNQWLLETQAQEILLGAGDGVYRFEGSRWGLWKSVYDKESKPLHISYLAQDTRGYIYGASGLGSVWQLDPGEPQLLVDDEPGFARPARIFPLRSGRVLVTGSRAGLLQLGPEGAVRAEPEASALPAGTVVNAVAEGSSGRLYLGTWGKGVFVLQSGRVTQVFDQRHDLQSLNIIDIFEDREGNLFVTTYGGRLWQAVRGKVTNLSIADGLGDKVAWGLGRGTDGVLRVIAMNGLLSEFFPDGRHELVDLKKLGLPGTLQGFSQDGPGYWVYGTGGAFRLDSAHKVLRRLTLKDGFISQQIEGITPLPNGALLVATVDKGLVEMPPSGPPISWAKAQGLTSTVFAVAPAGEGLFALATEEGIGYLDLNQRKAWIVPEVDGLSAKYINDVACDPQGVLWFASPRGLLRLEQGHLRYVTTKDGLPHDRVYAVVADGTDGVWAGTADGIAYVNSRLQITSFGRYAGMLDTAVTAESGYLDTDGRVWFGTLAGVSSVRKEEIESNAIRPVPRITGVFVNEASQSELGQVIVPGAEPQVSLSASQNNIRISFSAASLTHPEAVRFRSRIVGIDKVWSSPSKARDLTLKGVSHGRYTIELVACNEDSLCSEAPARLGLEIRPPYWATWTFRFGLFTVLCGALWAVMRLRVRALIRHEVELERLVLERTREVRELSLRDPLTGLRNRRFVQELMEGKGPIALDGNSQKRRPSSQCIGFYLIDIDYFKQVNDTFGHESGDLVLRKTAEQIQSVLRKDDVVARWGGEEFLVLASCPEPESLHVVAERIRRVMERTLFDVAGAVKLRKTCSIGYASYPFRMADCDSPFGWENVVALADLGLYRAKHNGRNRTIRILPGYNSPTDDTLPKALTSLDWAVEQGFLAWQDTTGMPSTPPRP